MGFAEDLALYNSNHAGAPVELLCQTPSELKLVLSGELDMKASSDLTPLLEAAVSACPEHGRLVLDLSPVGYIASMGVGLFAQLLVKAEKKSVSLVLLDISPRVRNVMDALGLLSFFTEENSSHA